MPDGASPVPTSEAWREMAELLAAERPRWLAFVKRRVPNDVDAEEVVHHALLRALAQIDTLKDPSRLRPWFFQILRRSATDARSARSRFVSDDSLPERAAPDRADAGDDAEYTCACVGRLMGVLRPEYVDVLSRVVLDGDSVRDVARSLSATENNTAVRLHRARAALRKELAACCGVSSYRACLDCMCDIDGTCAGRSA